VSSKLHPATECVDEDSSYDASDENPDITVSPKVEEKLVLEALEEARKAGF
jgi:hypothetical protein